MIFGIHEQENEILKNTDECVKVIEEAIFDLTFDEGEDFH